MLRYGVVRAQLLLKVAAHATGEERATYEVLQQSIYRYQHIHAVIISRVSAQTGIDAAEGDCCTAATADSHITIRRQ